MFYLPPSISWHICSENLVSLYFFQDCYQLAILSQTWLPLTPTGIYKLLVLANLEDAPSEPPQPVSSLIASFSPSPLTLLSDSHFRGSLLKASMFSHSVSRWFVHTFVHHAFHQVIEQQVSQARRKGWASRGGWTRYSPCSLIREQSI